MRPTDDPVAIYEEVGTVREEAVLVEDAVEVGHLALEVAEEVDLHGVLLLVLLQRVGRIDADREDDEAAGEKVVPVVTHLAQLGSTGRREPQRKEPDQA